MKRGIRVNKILKKLLILIIIVVNSIVIITACYTPSVKTTALITDNTSNTLEAIKKKGVLTIGSPNDKPFAYIDPATNNITGIDAEIVTEAAKRLGINKIEIKIIPFGYLLSELNTNTNVDIIASGLYVTDERKKEVSFTNVLYKEPEAIIALSSSNFNSKEDLKNAIVGSVRGTIFEQLPTKWKQEGLIKDTRTYQSQSELLLAISIGESDAGIIDSATAYYILPRYKKLSFTMLSSYKPEFPGFVAAAVRKNDTAFLDAINKKIDEMKEDGTLLKILKKYDLNENNFVSVEDGRNLSK